MRLFFFSAWTFLLAISYSLTLHAQTFSKHVYQEDASNIPNPERGFYHHTETQSGSYTQLNEVTLSSYRTQGITLILRVFYLSGFVSKPISDQYLASVQQDFNIARASGVKVIVRFAYTQKSTSPYGDATLEWVLKHIEQLTPVLQKNADVIAVVQAGFIGAWGEWYYTDNFSSTLGNPNAQDWQNRRALINALLNAVPESRSIQVRTPAIKYSLLESFEALTSTEAYSATSKARIGHHNDCFLASDTDYGTYTGNMETEKQFLEQETNYLPMGGETCGISVPLSECPNAIAQMKRFHWSFLNRDYHGDVLSSWESGACLPEVFYKLGYRYRLTKSLLQEESKPGGSVKFSVALLNDGWANPYNKRPVELVLKNTSSGKVLVLPLADDLRMSVLSDTIKLNIEAGLPGNIAEGDYEMFINFPDPEISLHGNPDYSIRLANTDTWDAMAGFNKLNHLLTVNNTAGNANYTGANVFSLLPALMEYSLVNTDGNSNDWQKVETIASGAVASHQLKVFNDADSVYFLIQGIDAAQSFEIFIDTDLSSASGNITPPWNSNYADYKISEEGISFYNAGGWSAPQAISWMVNGSVIEIGVDRDSFTNALLSDEIQIAAQIISDAGTVNIPEEDNAFVAYRMLLDTPTDLKATSSGSKVILYWSSQQDDLYRVIERSINNGDYKKISAITDQSFLYIDKVSEGSTAKYRSYFTSVDGLNLSTYSQPYDIQTSLRPDYYVFATDGNPSEWEGVEPLTTASFESNTQAYRIFMTAEKLHILFEGALPDSYAFYFDIDNSISTGSSNNAWAYGGFDFLVRNDSLYDLRGEAPVFTMLAEESSSTGFMEIAVPNSVFDNLNDNTVIFTAGLISTENTLLHFQTTEESPIKFIRTLPSLTPASAAVVNSEALPESQLIIKWQICAGCKGYIVERAENMSGPFSFAAKKNSLTSSFYDSNLTLGSTYYYHVYSYNDAGLSLPSPVVSGTPHAVTGLNHEFEKIISVYPNPADDVMMIDVKSSDVKTLEFINMMGQSLWQMKKINSGFHSTTDVSTLPAGIYILKAFGKSNYTFRVFKK
jgi:hypothetical protein